jgi:hypothetical protein
MTNQNNESEENTLLPSKLLKLQEFITLEDAARFLSELINQPVSEKDLRHYATDHLPLYLTPLFSMDSFYGFAVDKLPEELTLPPLFNLSKGEGKGTGMPTLDKRINIPEENENLPKPDIKSSALPLFPRPISFIGQSRYQLTDLSGNEYAFFHFSSHDQTISSFDIYDSEIANISVRPIDVISLSEKLNDPKYAFNPKGADFEAGTVTAWSAETKGPCDITGVNLSKASRFSDSAQHGETLKEVAESSVPPSRDLVIASLVKLIKEKTNLNQSAIAIEIEESSENRGLSKSNIEKIFANANRRSK